MQAHGPQARARRQRSQPGAALAHRQTVRRVGSLKRPGLGPQTNLDRTISAVGLVPVSPISPAITCLTLLGFFLPDPFGRIPAAPGSVAPRAPEPVPHPGDPDLVV